jgi:hypothetical protein
VSDVRKITGFFDGPKVDVLTSSGMLCVTVHPRPHWLVVALGFDVIFAAVLYYSWSSTPLFGRIIWMVILVSTLISSVYEFSGEEIIEIDSQRLTIRKGIHGWERVREYQIDECSNLEWDAGGEGCGSYLTCKVGRWPIRFGKGLSGDNATEILSALQRTLPDVAQKICAYPGGREHFITLGLNKR